MGKMSRNKGKSGEREVARILREHGFDTARRTSQHCGMSGDASDVVGIDGVHIEVKRCETTKIHEWMAQAERDSEGTGNMPVVFHRRNGEQWLCTMHMEDFLKTVCAVRCENCEFFDFTHPKMLQPWGMCYVDGKSFGVSKCSDDFCKRGKRKQND